MNDRSFNSIVKRTETAHNALYYGTSLSQVQSLALWLYLRADTVTLCVCLYGLSLECRRNVINISRIFSFRPNFTPACYLQQYKRNSHRCNKLHGAYFFYICIKNSLHARVQMVTNRAGRQQSAGERGIPLSIAEQSIGQ